ncbi:TPA: hypothetical protein DDZ86_02410 [Candidatus Dependentiae bacterium]|nr:MAG: Site-2 protease [candidate division TM6 bacterium GW2011_GWF2_43_87]HBL98472.1 hypothetical protein [Candidatus Dependentiae bacterium]
MAFSAYLFLALKGLVLLAVGLLGIGVLITIHELGHFLFCKLFGVGTPSFSIGFGPRILTKKIGETEFSISALPLGGYVEIAGNYEPGQGEQQHAAVEDDRSFMRKPFWQRALIMAGGIIANLLFAYIVFIKLFAIGMPPSPLLYPENVKTAAIGTVEKGGAAEKAGVLPGDVVVAVDGVEVKGNFSALLKQLEGRAQTNARLVVERNQQRLELPIVLGGDKEGLAVGKLEVSFSFTFEPVPPLSFGEAFKRGVALTNRLFTGVFGAVKNMVVKRSTSGMGGPLLIIAEVAKSVSSGLPMFLLLLAFISVNLAALNLIPLPILDGGQILVIAIEAVVRRPLPDKAKIAVAYGCWAVVLSLMLYLSIKDVIRAISWFFCW